MAKLFPETQIPKEIKFRGERDVARYLCEQLPSNVRIYHSYPWLHKDDKVLREGEADFIILDPRFGILIVEVKGGDIRYDEKLDRWYRINGTHDPKDPYEQASKSQRYFEKIIGEREFMGIKPLPFLRGRMVVFPDTQYRGSFPKGGCSEITVDARGLDNFEEQVTKIFRAIPGAQKIKDGIGSDNTNRIHKALYPNFKLTPALFRQIEHQEETLVRFTEEQRNLVDTIVAGSNYRARVMGVAGSGKTLLALHLAYQLADKTPDEKVLLVCFNEQLAAWISESLTPEYKPRIVATTYHKLCSDWTKKAPGLQWPKVDENNPEFWSNLAPNLLADAIDLMPSERFAAVVVDEGQDFRSEWWDTLELIGKDPGNNPFLVFYDDNQRIYDVGDSVAWPDLTGPFPLLYNCRNTSCISKYSGDLIGQNIPAKADAPEGDEPEFKQIGNSVDARKEILSKIRDWLNSGKLKPSQIAIVSTTKIENSCMSDVQKIGNTPITKNISAWRHGEGVLLTTVWKFKGLEADAMILCDAQGITNFFTKQHAYVACSRAKHLLTIISKTKDWQ